MNLKTSCFTLIAVLTLAVGAFHCPAQSNELSALPGIAEDAGPPSNSASATLTPENTPAPAPGTVAAAAAPDIWTGVLMILIPFVTPMIVLLGKTILPRMPAWCLPILAPAIGALLAWLTTVAGGPHVNPLIALVLGSAGVGLRELKDQVGWRIANGPAAMLAIFAGLTLSMTGCGTVQVADGADPIVVHAEWTAENGANAFDKFFAFERSNPTSPAVHEFAESLRSTRTKTGVAAQSLFDLRQATENYKANKTAANGDKAKAATVLLLDLANSARRQMGMPALSLPATRPSIRDQLNPATPSTAPPVSP